MLSKTELLNHKCLDSCVRRNTMRKISLLLPAICLALTPFTATADPVLTFNGGGGPGGVGPYNMTLNPGGPLSLFCLNELDHIQTTENWTVAVINGASLSTNSLTDSTAGLLLEFEEEAYIFSKYNGSNNTEVQDALWHIFDSAQSIDSTEQGWITTASTFAYTPTFLGNYTFYIYDNGTVNDPVLDANGAPELPQNFIGVTPLSVTAPTPEPSTLVMFGTGIMALAGVARRKLARG
jgi:hypothetical protein